MIEVDSYVGSHPANTPLGRFGIETLSDAPELFSAAMPLVGLTNPFTGDPTLGPLTVLVDYVGGLVNHLRRAPDEWTVSSELALDLVPDAAELVARDPSTPVIGTARPGGAKGRSSLGVCELTHDGAVLGLGSVRSVHITQPGELSDPRTQPAPEPGPRQTELADLMAVRAGDWSPGSAVLYQSANSTLNNAMGIVHGGVASAALELVAAAALAGAPGEAMQTASVRVNFLRQLLCGSDSHYQATAVRAGGRSGAADAQAIGADGRVALIARVTALR